MKYHIYEHEGRQYHCGCQPQKHAGKLRGYSAAQAVLTLAAIQAAIAAGTATLKSFLWVILNQGNRGDCWDYSEAQTAMQKNNLLYGEKIVFDTSVAVVITDQYDGGSIDSALLQLYNIYGIPTAAFMGTDPVNAKVNLVQSKWPKNWQANAKLRTVPADEWLQTSTALELASGICDGHPGVVGVDWQGGGHA